MTVIKHDWLHGDIIFNVDVKEETKCSQCVHLKVCKREMQTFCLNYCFGSTGGRVGCGWCLHRFTRWRGDKDRIPCFKCKFYKELID